MVVVNKQLRIIHQAWQDRATKPYVAEIKCVEDRVGNSGSNATQVERFVFFANTVTAGKIHPGHAVLNYRGTTAALRYSITRMHPCLQICLVLACRNYDYGFPWPDP